MGTIDLAEIQRDPSKDMLHELFEYKEGVLYHKKQQSKRVKIGDSAGCIGTKGYCLVGINGKIYYAHRLIWIMFNGFIPSDKEVDHIFGIEKGDRIENLRLGTHGQNQHNRGKYRNNTSGYKGVSWSKYHKKWLAKIRINTTQKFLGYYPTPELASKAYGIAAKKYHKEFAKF